MDVFWNSTSQENCGLDGKNPKKSIRKRMKLWKRLLRGACEDFISGRFQKQNWFQKQHENSGLCIGTRTTSS